MHQDTVTDQLGALGYQPVRCARNSDGEWSPLAGTTGGVPFPAPASPDSRPGPYRPAFRPPPGVLVLDVDDHDGQGTGPATIRKMEAELGPLPPTWHLTARGPGRADGRYLYRQPEDLTVTDAPFASYGGCVETVRTGHRFSWAEGDIHPGTGQPVTVYGPDGKAAPMPPVSALPELPEPWVAYLRRATTYGGGSGEATAGAAEVMAAWRDPDAEPPAHIAAELLAPWPAARHPELKARCLHLAEYAAGGWPGMGTLFGRLAGSFSAETGRDGYAEASGLLTWWLERPQLWPSARDALRATARQLAPAAMNGHAPAQTVPPPMVPQVPALKLVPASAITPEPVRWLWQDRLKLGGLALLAGDVGLGKSTIGIDVAARLTRGTLPGEYYGAPQNVIICATEDEWSDTVVPRLMAAGADLARVFQLTTAQEYGADLSLPVQVPELAGLTTGAGARLVILDPLMSRLDGRLDSHKDAEVRRALEPLVRMAGDTGVTVLGLIHQNKSGDHNAVNRVMGSRAFTAVARSVLYAAPLLTKDPSGETLVLAVPKNNNAPRGTADAYRIEPYALPGPPLISTTRIHWLDKLESFSLDAELGQAGSRKGATAVDRAAEWLTSYLTGKYGRADSADVRKAGKAAGHSVATLKRAMAEAGVTAENTDTMPRRTVWVLEDWENPVGSRAGGLEPTEPTGAQESVCELTTTNYLGKREPPQSAQSAQVSGTGADLSRLETAPGSAAPDGLDEGQRDLLHALQCHGCDDPAHAREAARRG